MSNFKIGDNIFTISICEYGFIFPEDIYIRTKTIVSDSEISRFEGHGVYSTRRQALEALSQRLKQLIDEDES